MKWLLLIIMCTVMLSGCSVLRSFMPGSSSVTELPETAKEQLFQTIGSTNWLLTLTIIGVGAGFFAFLNGSSKGLQFMAACFVTLSLVLGLNRYSAWIAAGAMIGAVGLVMYTVWVKNRALKEVVKGVQKVRESEPKARTVIAITESLNEVQSAVTKSIVKVVKGTL